MNWIKNMKYILYVFLICLGLQIIAYSLPQQSILKNVQDSAWSLHDCGIYLLACDKPSMQMDNFTDSWMLDIAGYSGEESVLKKAFGAYYYDFSNIPCEGSIGPYLALDELAKGNFDLQVGSYARYWHGYIFPLKVGLLWMNYSDLKMFNFFILISVYLVLFYLVSQKKRELCIPMVIWLLTVGPATFFSLCYAGVTYIALFSCIAVIKFDWAKMELSRLGIAFVIIGMLTNYIDVLSFPLITLGMPLIVLICFFEKMNYKKMLTYILTLSCCWGIGYAGMWAIKWIISGVVLGEDIIANALSAAKVRSSNISGEMTFTVLDVIKNSLAILFNKSYLVLIVVFGAFFCFRDWKDKAKIKIDKSKLMGLGLIAVFPAMWCIVFTNHTYEHFFTFRIWSISALALCIGISCSIERKEKIKPTSNSRGG